MKICKHCGAEQDDNNEFCTVCGKKLDEINNTDLEWELLMTAQNQFEADLVKNLLESNNIPVMLKRPGTGFDISNPYANPILGYWGKWNIFVIKVDLERAEEIIKNMEETNGTNENDNEGG